MMRFVLLDSLSAAYASEAVILRVGVSNAYFGFEIPVPAEYPSVSVGDAGAYEPALIAVVGEFREVGTEE